MRNKESKKWVLTDSRHEYCIKLLIGSNKEAEKGTWETKYLDRTQDYRFYSTEVQITQPYKMITNLRLNDFIAELGELKKHHCCSIFVNLFAIFDHSLIREAPFWNVLFLYGHCPNSFSPPTLPLSNGHCGALSLDPIFYLFFELNSAQTILASILTLPPPPVPPSSS